jgi:hypothetical protein
MIIAAPSSWGGSGFYIGTSVVKAKDDVVDTSYYSYHMAITIMPQCTVSINFTVVIFNNIILGMYFFSHYCMAFARHGTQALVFLSPDYLKEQ